MQTLKETVDRLAAQLATQAYDNYMGGSNQPFYDVDYHNAALALKIAYDSTLTVEELGTKIHKLMHKLYKEKVS